MSPGAFGIEDGSGVDAEVLIRRILAVDSAQRAEMRDVTFDAVYVERDNNDEAGPRDKVRIVKKVYLRFDPDTTLFHETYLQLFKDGVLRDESDLRSEEKTRREDKAKRKGRDIAYPFLRPFRPEMQDFYAVSYRGIEDDLEDLGPCHHFRVTATEESDSLINGDYYFEAATFHLARVDFSPARLVKKTMFRLKELRLSLVCGPVEKDIWLPRRFEVSGKGKAALFFGVDFAGTEYYRNPIINSGLSDSLFAGENHE
jgi:hypothetical protein